MRGREILNEIIKSNDISQAELAKKLNITPAAVWDRIDTKARKGKPRRDILSLTLASMLNVLGYKLLIVPNDIDLPRDSYEVK